MKKPISGIRKRKEGTALLVALFVLMILTVIIGSFAFEVKLESMLVSYKRKKFRAEMMARSGLEYGRALLDAHKQAKELEIEDMDEDKDGFMKAALYIQRGLPAPSTIEFPDGGKFTVTVEPADTGRNINLLTRDQWLDIFEMANVPSSDWDAMIDCLEDWIDENDFHGLNGAESDDPFYEEAGYPVKNGPLDSVEELLLVKNWSPAILYGRPATDGEEDEIIGIADKLTVWGDGKVNLNAATADILLSYSEYEDWELESVFEARKGEDGEADTLDDGIKSLGEVGADGNKFKLQSTFVKVTSVGEIFGNQYQIECIVALKAKDSTVVYWNEGPVKKNANTR
ncbi:general secretion pathway protein GspK [Pontiella sp.]|uniref:general secretion pathway protein GspK n=1 Tax=Pontiella sp. TaxID=2837462 RepID=UPI00356AA969